MEPIIIIIIIKICICTDDNNIFCVVAQIFGINTKKAIYKFKKHKHD